MPKINIITRIKSKTSDLKIKTTAIIQDEILKYQEEKNKIVIFFYQENKLIRETNELKINYIFDQEKETIGTIFIKNLNKYINVPIKTIKFEKENYNVDIIYKIEKEKYHFQIKESI